MEAHMTLNLHKALFRFVFILSLGSALWAQDRSELAFSAGGGALQVDSGSSATPVFGVSYLYHITDHVSAEGSLDLFFHKFLTGPVDSQEVFWDGYTGAEAALVYHFKDWRDTGRWIPFAVVGIGKTTTDFTEIQASRYIRLGGGVSYHFTEKLGGRVEIRDEIINKLYSAGGSNANLPSVRASIVYRF
jgi:hypothetical protein